MRVVPHQCSELRITLSSACLHQGGLLSSMDSAARSLRSNMRELGSSIQAATVGGGSRSGFSRLHAPQRTAEEEMLPILEARDFAAGADDDEQERHQGMDDEC